MVEQSFLFNDWDYNYQKDLIFVFIPSTECKVHSKQIYCIFFPLRSKGPGQVDRESPFSQQLSLVRRGATATLGSKVCRRLKKKRWRGGLPLFVSFFLFLVKSLQLGSEVAVLGNQELALSILRRLRFLGVWR